MSYSHLTSEDKCYATTYQACALVLLHRGGQRLFEYVFCKAPLLSRLTLKNPRLGIRPQAAQGAQSAQSSQEAAFEHPETPDSQEKRWEDFYGICFHPPFGQDQGSLSSVP